MTTEALFDLAIPETADRSVSSPATDGGCSVPAGLVRNPEPDLTVIAHGQPAPQGSKDAFVNRHTGRAGMKENNPQTAPWREIVSWAVRRAMTNAGHTEPIAGPVRVAVVFTMRKPASAPKRRRTWPATKPDVDKLQRAVFDAVTTAGGWTDDARVVDVHAVKAYPGEHEYALSSPGMHLRVWRVTEC